MPSNDESSKLLPPLIPLTVKAAKYQSIVFMREITSRLEELHQETLSIFVFGPNEAQNPLSAKRIETINSLRSLGHAAFTGEEMVPKLIEIDVKNGHHEKPFNYYERILAEKADFIIIFCASPGSIGETHEFLSAPVIAQKTLVCIDEAFNDGYTSNGIVTGHKLINGQVIKYKSPDDLIQCKLKTSVLNRTEDFQIAKAIQKIGY
jgi:hypothetical protein